MYYSQKYMERVNKKCVSGKKEREHPMWIAGIGLLAFQQLCGANTLIFYANEIFDEFIAADVYSGKAQALTVTMLTAQVMCTPPNSRALSVCTMQTSHPHRGISDG